MVKKWLTIDRRNDIWYYVQLLLALFALFFHLGRCIYSEDRYKDNTASPQSVLIVSCLRDFDL